MGTNTPSSMLRLPIYPASWYLFGEARELARGPITKKLLGRELVAYRARSGKVAVMTARCSHFGADLGKGQVIGDCLQCPFHGWRYSPDGRCLGVPAGGPVPDFAHLEAYSAEERHGLVFFFNGPRPLFDFPRFFSVDDGDIVAGRPFSFAAEASWPTVAAHAFDLQHFRSVHDRRLTAEPVIDAPQPFVRRLRYQAQLVPQRWQDSALAGAGGKAVEGTLAVWGGTFTTIEARFRQFTSHFFMVNNPESPDTTRCHVIVFAPRGVLSAIGLAIRRYLTRAYVAGEPALLAGTRADPARFIAADQAVKDFFDSVAQDQSGGLSQ